MVKMFTRFTCIPIANDLRLNETHLRETCNAAGSMKNVRKMTRKVKRQNTINCQPELHVSSAHSPEVAVAVLLPTNGGPLFVAATQVQLE